MINQNYLRQSTKNFQNKYNSYLKKQINNLEISKKLKIK